MTEETREAQYNACLELRDRKGLTTFGLMSNYAWHTDPKRLCFHLSRYKFVSRMFNGFDRVLEVGCADAFGTRIVCQSAKAVTVVDFDPVFIKDVDSRRDPDWPFEARVHDMLEGPVPGDFSGAYSLDVLEHIPKEIEGAFLKNMVDSLAPDGVLIIGTPSLESQKYASPGSVAGHVNCKSGEELRALLKQFFANVFIFSMNDEVVHTGFVPMAHYLFALCCSRLPTQRT